MIGLLGGGIKVFSRKGPDRANVLQKVELDAVGYIWQKLDIIGRLGILDSSIDKEIAKFSLVISSICHISWYNPGT